MIKRELREPVAKFDIIPQFLTLKIARQWGTGASLNHTLCNCMSAGGPRASLLSKAGQLPQNL